MKKIVFLMLIFSIINFACSTKEKKIEREPSSTSDYSDNENQFLLEYAANQKILLLMTDQDLKDFSYSQVESCRNQGNFEWPQYFFDSLKYMNGDESLANKVHIIQIVKSDRATATVVKQKNGISILYISYLKTENRSSLQSLSQISCPKANNDYIGKPLINIGMSWPNQVDIQTALKQADLRTDIKEWNFSTKWLTYLSQNMTILRASDEMVADPQFVQYFMDEYSLDLAELKQPVHIPYWLKQINTRSNMALLVQTFKINKTINTNYGIKVDSLGKIARKINGSSDPTYLFLNLKFDNSGVIRPKLQDLEKCLGQMSERHQDRRNFHTEFEDDRDAYLYPGYNCNQ